MIGWERFVIRLKKEILKEQAQMLIDQIKEEQKLLDEDSEKEEKSFLKAAKGFK